MGIYISLGGAGIKSLSRLKAKIYAEYIDKSLFEHENAFLFIDTDLNDVAKIQSDPVLTKMYGNKPIIDLDEFIPLGNVVPNNIRKAAMDSHERTFADQATIKQFKTQIEELRTQLVPLN